MERLAFIGVALGGAALCLTAACDSSGTVDSQTKMSFGGSGGGSGEVVILDAGGDAATPPDGVTACPTGVCNYQSGIGCPAQTPACIPAGNLSPECSPAGAGKTGSTCAKQADCAAGYFCVQTDAQCHKLCCGGDWTGCDSPSEHCITNLDYPNGSTGAMLCYPVNTCDALTPTSCTPAGTACLIADATGATACLPPGTGGTGQPCPCQGGFACVTEPNAASTCHRLCKAVAGGAPPYCQAGEGDCVHHTRDPAGVGECLNL
jgi:hypothetical protein